MFDDEYERPDCPRSGSGTFFLAVGENVVMLLAAAVIVLCTIFAVLLAVGISSGGIGAFSLPVSTVPEEEAAVGQRGLADDDRLASRLDEEATTAVARSKFYAFHDASDPGADGAVTLPDGRELSVLELQAVERARAHLADTPGAPVEAVVRIAFPNRYVTFGNVGLHWKTTLRPALSAFTTVAVDDVENDDVVVETATWNQSAETALDVDAEGSQPTAAAPEERDEAASAGSGSTHSGAGRETVDVETDSVPGGTDRRSAKPDSSDDVTHDPSARRDRPDIAAAVENPADETEATSNGDAVVDDTDAADGAATAAGGSDAEHAGGLAFGLPAPFVVQWVDVDERVVRVAGDDHTAAFDVLDRKGALGVKPVGDAYRSDDGAPENWFVTAADALESALPDSIDDLDAPGSPWPTGDGVRVGFEFESALNCRTLDEREDGYRVEVSDGENEVVLDVHRSVATFEDAAVREETPRDWVLEAITAAEAHVMTHHESIAP